MTERCCGPGGRTQQVHHKHTAGARTTQKCVCWSGDLERLTLVRVTIYFWWARPVSTWWANADGNTGMRNPLGLGKPGRRSKMITANAANDETFALAAWSPGQTCLVTQNVKTRFGGFFLAKIWSVYSKTLGKLVFCMHSQYNHYKYWVEQSAQHSFKRKFQAWKNY